MAIATSVRLGDLGTGHVWYVGVGAPAGHDLLAEEGDGFLELPDDWCDLTGAVVDGRWEWDGRGHPHDWRGNSVQRIVAFVA